MVVINGVKYACDRCIRGHRVSGCRHVDQPLKMIKRKGRPPTQCGSCKKTRSKSSFGNCACPIPADAGDPAHPANLLGMSNQEKHMQRRSPGSSLSDVILQAELSPDDIARLRQRPDVKIELPDGAILGPKPFSEPQAYPQPSHYMHPYPSMHASPYAHPHPPQIPDDEYLLPDRYRYQPQHYGRMAVPYNADLYNDSTGNNAAAAVMNARGDGGYAPNTGTVHFQPKLMLEHELSASTQELADSLHGMIGVRPRTMSHQEFEAESSVSDPNDPYGTNIHISKLSNLY